MATTDAVAIVPRRAAAAAVAIVLAHVAAAGTPADARAQPGADLPPPPPPPPLDELTAALAAVDAGPDWQRVAPTAWRHREGLALAVADAPGACLGRLDAEADALAPYFRLRASPSGRIDWCLQRGDRAIVVSADGLADPGATVEALRALDALRARIADALRPPVGIPGLGELRTRLPLTPIPDGFAIDGLPAPTVVHVRAVTGTCASAPGDPALAYPLVAPRGARWAGDARAGADDATLCLERGEDALAVTVHGSILAPTGVSPSTPVTWHPELRAVLEALHDAVDRGGPPPRWFGLTVHQVALPRVGVDLRGTTSRGDGWEIDRTPGTYYKVVDGAAYGEPATDLLVPRYRQRLAVGFTRGPCAIAARAPGADRASPALVPAEVGGLVVDASPSFRARACVRAPAGEYVVVIRTIDEGAPANHDDVRSVVAAFAESVGVRIAGRQRRIDGAILLAVPLVRDDDGAVHGGLAVRMRFLLQLGRPWSLMVGGELAFGAAGDAYHPAEAPPPGPDEEETLELPGDVLAEARLAIGAGAELGPVAIDAMATAAAAHYWPDDSWLDVGLGASWWRGRDRLRVRYAVTPLRWAQSLELSAARPPVALLLRVLDFPTDEPAHTDAGAPARALELAIGVSY